MVDRLDCAQFQGLHTLGAERCVGASLAPSIDVPARMLIVEDNASTSFAVRAFFQSTGYDVDAALDRPSAIRLLGQHDYDVVITDLNLSAPPCGEGMDVISAARSRHADACIIMLTAFGSPAVEQEARRRGANLFCAKPVGLRDLSAFIDTVRRHDDGTPAASSAERQ